MQTIPRWRNLLNLKGVIIQSTRTTLVSSSKSNYFLADFHSTSTAYEKWKGKWNPDSNGKKPSKDYIRYRVRQKRADAKKALKNLLFNGGEYVHNDFQVERDTVWEHLDGEYNHNQLGKKDRSKSSHASRRAAKAQHKRIKRKLRREKFDETDDWEDKFRASFGKKWCTWAYWSEKDFSYESSNGFRWKEQRTGDHKFQQESDTEDENNSFNEACVIGMSEERKALGLPSNGPLKIEEIKTAFRISALKWHPDKHQGPSQAMAEEKFKYCVDAYKSLCSSLSKKE